MIIVFGLLCGQDDFIKRSRFANMCKEKLKLIEIKNYNNFFTNNNAKLTNDIMSYCGLFKKFNDCMVFLNSCSDKLDNLNLSDLKDYVYNDLLLSNLVKIRHLNNLNSTDGLNYKESFVNNSSNYEPELVLEQYPFLKTPNEQKYTLVLDLDETLVHYVEEDGAAFVQIRPFTEIFVDTLCKYYEVVIFTAALSDVFKPLS
jgi:hypothetical protein